MAETTARALPPDSQAKSCCSAGPRGGKREDRAAADTEGSGSSVCAAELKRGLRSDRQNS